MNQEKTRHSVETEVLQNVLNYLNSRPYGEVAQLVQGIMQTQKQETPAPALQEVQGE